MFDHFIKVALPNTEFFGNLQLKRRKEEEKKLKEMRRRTKLI
jgi:hypothetical protein